MSIKEVLARNSNTTKTIDISPDNILADMIKKVTNNQNSDSNRNGSNKKCYIADGYVLLEGRFKEEILKKQMIAEAKLKEEGYPIHPTLAYTIVEEPNAGGYTKGYTLQPQAKGSELFNKNMTTEEYHTRLNEIANLGPKKLEKFVSDYIAIASGNILLDPSKSENFFYTKDGISFIDLNYIDQPRPHDLDGYFGELSTILTGCYLPFKHKTPDEKLLPVLKTLSHIFLEKGLNPEAARETLSRRLKDEKTVDMIISNVPHTQPLSLMQRDGGR